MEADERLIGYQDLANLGFTYIDRFSENEAYQLADIIYTRKGTIFRVNTDGSLTMLHSAVLTVWKLKQYLPIDEYQLCTPKNK